MSINPGLKILLVEDAAVMRKMEKKTLAGLGLENILEAENGAKAIEIMETESNIEMVISDWNMPEKSGYDLLLWIRAHEQFNNIPFVMATGRGEKKEISKAEEAGVSAFISKPFDANELREKMEIALGMRSQGERNVREIQRNAEGKVILHIAHIQITDHLVLGVMKHLIQTKKFQPQHFELQTSCMPSWNPLAKALEFNQVDGACVLAPIAMDLYGHGVPIKLTLFAHKNGSIFVRNRKGGDYQVDPENFFHHKTFYLPHFQSIHHMLAHMFFTNIGLKPGFPGDKEVDLNFEVVPPVQMPNFLSNNESACGYLVAEPLGTKAIAAGIAELQFLSSELWENHPCCVVTMQDQIIQQHPGVVQEFTDLLVKAGQFIDEKPGLAAEIAVDFLDPDKTLGLKVALLKNVLMEPMGIKTGDLYPVKADLDRIQQYMYHEMGIGKIVDLDDFVDLQFANQACSVGVKSAQVSVMHDVKSKAQNILKRKKEKETDSLKSLLNKEGKYLIFGSGDQEFGMDILKVREIIRMIPIRTVPKSPGFVRGIISFRNNVIPILDLRQVLESPSIESNRDTRIVVVEIESRSGVIQTGIIVDKVNEVIDIQAKDIVDTNGLGIKIHKEYVLALAKINNRLKILLDINKILEQKGNETLSGFAAEVKAA